MTSRPHVLVTHWVHPEAVDLLAAHATVDVNTERRPWPRAEVLRRAAGADGVMAFITDRVDTAFVQACPRLRVVGGAVRAYDQFDLEACSRAGVWVSVVPDLLAAPTAELAVGLAITLGRKIMAGDRMMRDEGFAGWRPRLYGSGLAGATVGIAGLGAVGQGIARRLAGFDARLLGFDRYELPHEQLRALALRQVGWEHLVAESDVLVLALPLTPGTRGLFDDAAIRRMRRNALVVNVGRGSVVDEEAVANALASGRLGGYAADVFALEDLCVGDRPRTVPPELLAMTDRTVFTPHLGSAVDEVRRDVALVAARNILAALRGEAPPNAINRPEGLTGTPRRAA